VRVIERRVRPEELGGFSECFVVGTAAEVTAVGEIGSHEFTPGAMTWMLRDAYIALVTSPAPARIDTEPALA
jgi:branched-chain amino acid aminotransferase